VIPRATYRLQFRKSFPFAAATDLADYFAGLGVSHVYSSPIMTARADSAHGYDVVLYDRINEELGGEAGFCAMAEVLRNTGIGIILDIVPNHTAVGGADNPMWLDVLKHGRSSRYASWFDIDFDVPDPKLRGKIHAPFLGESLDAAVAAGRLELTAMKEVEGFAFRYGEHLFPIRPEDDALIAKTGVAASATPASLAALLDRQHYVLDVWSNAGDRINWRRFFDITQLAAMRMETPEAFAAKHALPLKLYRDGLIDGLRIDHVDGLADPAAYCRRLRHALDEEQLHRPLGLRDQRAWLLVEKILAHEEVLPEGWDVDGTTGYDFMDQVSALQHDPAASGDLDAHWSNLSGRSATFDDEEVCARRQILDHAFDGARDRLVDAALAAIESDGRPTRAAMRRVVTAALVGMRAYRGYAPDAPNEPGLHPAVRAALQFAAGDPLADHRALDALRLAFERADPASRLTARQFHHLSAPLAAKAVEDTAFYRYGRLLSRNDVGFHAASLGVEASHFHRSMEKRSALLPSSMLATATHDHKRGEDVRARLAVLSEMPTEWIDASDRWRAINAGLRPPALAAADEYMLLQMIVGCWPPGLEASDRIGLVDLAARLSTWWRKALREAKLRTAWSSPDETYEADAIDFVEAVLDSGRSPRFLSDISAFVQRIAPTGAANGLVQTALRCMAPGVPDTYQGTEFWDFSMVDPDNRRPVDFALRMSAFKQSAGVEELIDSWPDGRIKLAMLARLLHLRRALPIVFECGTYEPIEIDGARAKHALAFIRRSDGQAVLFVGGRLMLDGMQESPGLAPAPVWWGDAELGQLPNLPTMHPIFGPALDDGPRLSALLPHLPIGVWASKPL
jgi:(1->4)-alpha-D-glucan 1-alpha-D-glucosylmutase